MTTSGGPEPPHHMIVTLSHRFFLGTWLSLLVFLLSKILASCHLTTQILLEMTKECTRMRQPHRGDVQLHLFNDSNV